MNPKDKENLSFSRKEFKDIIKQYIQESSEYILIVYTKDDSIALSTEKPEIAKEKLNALILSRLQK